MRDLPRRGVGPARPRRAPGCFERLGLEGFQSGLSWETILRKREGFRAAFAGFEPESSPRSATRDVERLLDDPGDGARPGQDRGGDRQRPATVAMHERGETLDGVHLGARPQGRAQAPRTLARHAG